MTETISDTLISGLSCWQNVTPQDTCGTPFYTTPFFWQMFFWQDHLDMAILCILSTVSHIVGMRRRADVTSAVFRVDRTPQGRAPFSTFFFDRMCFTRLSDKVSILWFYETVVYWYTWSARWTLWTYENRFEVKNICHLVLNILFGAMVNLNMYFEHCFPHC